MPKFIKRPVVIEAVQWMGNNYEETKNLIIGNEVGFKTISIGPHDVLEAQVRGVFISANIGDWIIKDTENKLYTLHNDVFTATYEEIKNHVKP